MNARFRSLLSFFLCLPSLAWSQTPPADPSPPKTALFSTHPSAKSDGTKWRLGYYESGDYEDYPRILREIVGGLGKLGWLDSSEIPSGLSGKETWEFLARNARSESLEFVSDAYWKPGNFDAAQRPAVMEQVKARLSRRDDIDLIIAMGTWAGQDMAALGTPVPTVVASTSDAVGARIVSSAVDSGQDNLHARVQPERYQRQLRLFHETVGFKTLGVVYEDSPAGRTYAAVDAVAQVAQEKGFSVKKCDTGSSGADVRDATRSALRCYEELKTKVDAMYVTVHRGLTPHAVEELAASLRHAKIPSFAMLGAQEVRAGLLMSLTQADYSYVGRFHAETIARIFNGARPRQLTQIWVDPAKIALNLGTARQIGFDPSLDMLLAADEIYETR
ncbi:ABC transporter substrate-binding protein [Achromobacter marplatensis]|uniref:ABC transporter substrate-binding protein n=1 Tax=Achromobacter marplatensis TaxID=470868 RepID=UPI0039F680AA